MQTPKTPTLTQYPIIIIVDRFTRSHIDVCCMSRSSLSIRSYQETETFFRNISTKRTIRHNDNSNPFINPLLPISLQGTEPIKQSNTINPPTMRSLFLLVSAGLFFAGDFVSAIAATETSTASSTSTSTIEAPTKELRYVDRDVQSRRKNWDGFSVLLMSTLRSTIIITCL